jgi:hypothetical protein
VKDHATASAAHAELVFESCAALAHDALGDLTGLCLLDRALAGRGQSGQLRAKQIAHWLRRLGWLEAGALTPITVEHEHGQWLTVIPLEDSEGTLFGAFCVQQRVAQHVAQSARYAAQLLQRLRPALDRLHHEHTTASGKRPRPPAIPGPAIGPETRGRGFSR